MHLSALIVAVSTRCKALGLRTTNQVDYGKPQMAAALWPVVFASLLLVAFSLFTGCTMKTEMLRIEGFGQPLAPGTILDSASGRILTFDQLMDRLSQARVIYVGENHTSPACHAIQLQVIKALVARGETVSVGMEMFDHTYQAKLDQWSAGKWDWSTFLKQTHWYANWGYDDALYKDILETIKAKHLKLVGLNIPFCIPPKIAIGGLDSLSAAERAQLPAKIDLHNQAHRDYVRKVFERHPFRGHEDFENFYAAQCAWEDGMAQAIADHLAKGPMVVLVGNGHIIRKFGVPDRAFERTHAAFFTVYLASPQMTVSRQDADFIWVTNPVSTETAMH